MVTIHIESEPRNLRVVMNNDRINYRRELAAFPHGDKPGEMNEAFAKAQEEAAEWRRLFAKAGIKAEVVSA